MERKEFIKLLTTGTLLGCAGCLESQNSYPAPSEIDFTLDLTQGENAVLQSAGASLVKYGVIIARQLNNEFVVFSKACSHLGATLRFQPSQNNFVCPRHYSYFDITGFPINGPASLPIRKYKTELDGNNLRVYSF
jgi:cytochrome b6-f complex iron-sulfur subunit